MSNAKPTILLLHGAFHPPAAWERVIAQLSTKGYRCVAPQVCFVGGTGKAPSTWHPCVEQVQKVLSEETSAGRDVVVVNHSLGSLAGCSSIEGYTKTNSSRLGEGSGHVLGMVQISGMIIRDAEHHHEVFKMIPGSPDENGWKDPPLHAVKQVFYDDLEPADADYWASQLIPNSAWLDKSAEGLYPGYKDVPVWYIVCDNDKMLPPPVQEGFMSVIREFNDRLTERHIDTAHSPFLNKPEATAEYIHEAAVDFVA